MTGVLWTVLTGTGVLALAIYIALAACYWIEDPEYCEYDDD
jgi:hypothetical protein